MPQVVDLVGDDVVEALLVVEHVLYSRLEDRRQVGGGTVLLTSSRRWRVTGVLPDDHPPEAVLMSIFEQTPRTRTANLQGIRFAPRRQIMRRTSSLNAAVALVVVLTFTSGCASWGSKQTKGAGIGAAGGGALGALIGHKTGSTVRGAIIGAVVGGAAGAIIGNRMDAQAEKLAQELEDAQVSRVGEGIAVTFDSGILFAFDSAELRPEARSNLRKLADSLEAEARTNVMIVGHTDSAGSDAYNQQLSERRGRSAEDYLASLGVASSRLDSRGRGEVEPISSNETDEGRRQNRRVELAIYANDAWRDEAKRTGTR